MNYYNQFRKSLPEDYDPFAEPNEMLLTENKFTRIWANRFPYSNNHLLITSTQKTEWLSELDEIHRRNFLQLFLHTLPMILYSKGYDSFTGLLRAKKSPSIQKSVKRLHAHLIGDPKWLKSEKPEPIVRKEVSVAEAGKFLTEMKEGIAFIEFGEKMVLEHYDSDLWIELNKPIEGKEDYDQRISEYVGRNRFFNHLRTLK